MPGGSRLPVAASHIERVVGHAGVTYSPRSAIVSTYSVGVTALVDTVVVGMVVVVGDDVVVVLVDVTGDRRVDVVDFAVVGATLTRIHPGFSLTANLSTTACIVEYCWPASLENELILSFAILTSSAFLPVVGSMLRSARICMASRDLTAAVLTAGGSASKSIRMGFR